MGIDIDHPVFFAWGGELVELEAYIDLKQEGSFLATLLQLTCVVRTPPIGETICQGRSSPRFCSKTGKKTVFVLFLRTSDEPCSGNPQEGSTTCMHTAALLDIVKYRFSLVRAPLLQRSMKFYNQVFPHHSLLMNRGISNQMNVCSRQHPLI